MKNKEGLWIKLDLREEVAKAQGNKDKARLEIAVGLVWLSLWKIKGES